METCPSCAKSFPNGALLDVFIENGGKMTQQLLCRECGLRATRGLHAMEVKPPKATNAEISGRESARQEHERAVTLMDSGKYRDALPIFKRVSAATADDPEPMNFLNIAVCHAHLGEFKESLAIIEDAMRRWPKNDRLRMNYDGIKQDADAAERKEKERVSRELEQATLVRERQESESARRAAELRIREIQAQRRASRQCILCGKPLTRFPRLFSKQHKQCTQFSE